MKVLSCLMLTHFALIAINGEYAEDYAGSYGDYYEEDNIFQDYAERQERKAAGGGGKWQLVASTAVGYLVGSKYHSDRVSKKLKSKHQKDQKALYTQYYNDVYKLQEQNAELANHVKKLEAHVKEVEDKAELDALQRDYDEFKQPDVDNDDKISRAEFNMYVKNYLTNYPGLTDKDMPRFEEFDHDRDGYINFTEYVEQMKVQVQKAEYDQYQKEKAGVATNKERQQLDALRGLLNNSHYL